MTVVPPSAPLQPPPQPNGPNGLRRVGVEIEFGALDAGQAAELVRGLYGGEIAPASANAYTVDHTIFGRFLVKLDWSYADFPEAEIVKRAADGDLVAKTAVGLAHAVGSLGAVIMPHEIVAPPIPFDKLPALEALIAALRQAGAEDTRAEWLHAYALQLNPEAPSLEAHGILTVLRAYALMSDWLRAQIHVYFTRRVGGYIDPFPDIYVRTILAPDYDPPLDMLIDDYLAANPTRNRELDLLPLFAHLDEPRVRGRLDDPRIRPRPAYHYRLPDCRLADPAWGVTVEWNRWVEVERLAADPARLAALSAAFLRDEARGMPWAEVVQRTIAQSHGRLSA